MWIPPEMKYCKTFTLKNFLIFLDSTFIDLMYGTSLKTLAPLSPVNLPDKIPSHLDVNVNLEPIIAQNRELDLYIVGSA